MATRPFNCYSLGRGLGIFVPIPEFTNTTSKRLQSDTTVLPPPHLVQAASWWEGDKHFLHLRTLLMALTHSAPGANSPQGPKDDAQLEQIGGPNWSLVFPFPLPPASLPPELPCWPLPPFCRSVLSSSKSDARRLFLVALLSLLDWSLRPSPTSASGGSASWRPGTWALTAAPAATTKEGHSNSHPSRLSGRNSCHASWGLDTAHVPALHPETFTSDLFCVSCWNDSKKMQPLFRKLFFLSENAAGTMPSKSGAVLREKSNLHVIRTVSIRTNPWIRANPRVRPDNFLGGWKDIDSRES